MSVDNIFKHVSATTNKTVNVLVDIVRAHIANRSRGLLPSGLVAQSVERRRSNPKVVGSIPTLVRVFLCPCVGPFPSVGLTLTWFIWDRNLALHITLYSVNSANNYKANQLGTKLRLHCHHDRHCFRFGELSSVATGEETHELLHRWPS